eukprot:UN03019
MVLIYLKVLNMGLRHYLRGNEIYRPEEPQLQQFYYIQADEIYLI